MLSLSRHLSTFGGGRGEVIPLEVAGNCRVSELGGRF